VPSTLADMYRFHVANLRSVERALRHVERLARAELSTGVGGDLGGQNPTLQALVRLDALLVAAWAECRLMKVLHEPASFNDADRGQVMSKREHLSKWTTAVEVSYRRHYDVPRAALGPGSLPHSAYQRLLTLRELLELDLRPVIEVRNKLAHGQWEYAFTNNGDDVSEPLTRALRTENLLSLHFKMTIVTHLAEIVHNLAVSQPTFERDFDREFGLVVSAQRNLQARSYPAYALMMQEKYQRGRVRRGTNGA